MDEKVLKRFWAKVNKDGPIPAHVPHLGKCWVWTGCCHRARWAKYGQFKVERRVYPAHRVAWEAANGRRPATHEFVMHLCDNNPCVNPSHLKLGSHRENMADMAAKGRQPGGTAKGERVACHKLTAAAVTEIRELSKSVPLRALARQFGVTQRAVQFAVRRRTWKHIP